MGIFDERVFSDFRCEYLEYLKERQYDTFDGVALNFLEGKIVRVEQDDDYVLRCACELALGLIRDLRG